MRVAAIVLALAVLTALGIGSVVAPAAPGARRAIAPAPWLERTATVVRSVPASAPLTGTVVLKPRDNATLTRFIAAVSDRRSAGYGQYLAPGRFAGRFGPTAATVTGVEAALRAGGLQVGGVSSSRMMIHFSGTAGDVRAAFGTTLQRYRLRDGTLARGTSSAVRLPAALAGSVAAVVGLDVVAPPRRHDVPHPMPSQAPRHAAARGERFAHPAGSPRACRAARAASVAADGLTDDQVANAYGAFGLYTGGDRGAGQRIALYENEPFLRSDIRTFDTCYFGARRAAAMLGRLHVISVDGGQPTGTGTGEASLDVQDVSALAPGATIDVYEGPYTGTNPSDYDSLDEYGAIINADRDRVVSTSWGLCEQSVQQGQPGIQQAENLLFEQAAAQGQTVFSAAGDNGSDDCNSSSRPKPVSGQDPLSVDDPSSQPYVVAVGGTGIDNASARSPVEQVWNGGPMGGSGGGGISQSWQMPAWQRASAVAGVALPGGAVYRDAAAAQRRFRYRPGFCATTASAATAGTLPASTTALACRLLPDVSAEGDSYTGSISVYSAAYAGTPYSKNGWTTTGGTSSSAPIWAAMLALVNASPSCAAHRPTAAGVGFALPQLYAVASEPASYRAAFNDVKLGNNDIDGIGGGRLFAAGPGYDLASGLGSPRLTGPGGTVGLASYLCGGSSARRPVVKRLSPSSSSVAGGQTLTITGTGFSAGVAGVQIGGRRLARGSVRVTGPGSIAVTLPPADVAPFAPAPQDGAGPANVIVILRDGSSNVPSPRATFDYVDRSSGGALPSVSAISPSGGSQRAPRPVTILGSGFTAATAVTFGGVRAAHFRVNRGGQITVTPPALSSATDCAPLPATGAYAGETAGNDVCQVVVRVDNGAGSSASSQIRAPHEGAISTNALGDTRLPPGCGCEGVTAPDEYDYVPTPRITSVSTSAGPAYLASEKGTTLITVRGRGLNPLALDWANFGDPRRAASVDTQYQYLSGTELQVTAPAHAPTVGPASVRFSVKTLAGQAPAVRAAYAGVPRVRQVVNPRNQRRLLGVSGASDAGGTSIRVLGEGFAGQLSGPLRFAVGHGGPAATEYRYRVRGSSQLQTTTVGQTPGIVDVRVCTVSGCSAAGPSDRLWLYPPGDPSVSSVTPRFGPAAGGTRTTIRGADLGCPLVVAFGRRPAKSTRSGPGAGSCGTAGLVSAVTPAGRAATTVPVAVVTVESFFTHSGLGTTRARFRYMR
ncbi:MAG: protease pro-enzyme activation domain-containing protein [Solirubrobacteraceae bacterium]